MRLFIIIIFIIINAIAYGGQRVGLVLSGGGAKGIAHIGVIRALEKEGIKIDYISGTSMGGLIGALYSIGYTTDQLEEILKNNDWNKIFNDSYSRKYLPMQEKEVYDRYFGGLTFNEKGLNIPNGIIAGQNLEMLLCRLTLPVHDIEDFTKFKIPFSCAATDISTGETIVLKSGYISEALRASMAVPTVFAPMNIDDRVLIDGFLSRNLPVTEVREMGADIVIAVDVGDPLLKKEQLKSFVEIMNQIISLRGYESVMDERKKADIVLAPDVISVQSMNFNNIEDVIKKGEESVILNIAQIREKIVADKYIVLEREPIVEKKKIMISEVEIKGLNRVSHTFVYSILNIQKWQETDIDMIHKNIDKLYSTKFFDKVYYRILKGNVGNKIVIYVREKNSNTFNIGFKYNTEENANIIINGVFDNAAERGSRLSADLKLGENPSIGAEYLIHPFSNTVGTRIEAGYFINKGYYYEENKKAASFDYHNSYIELFLGNIYNTNVAAGGGIKKEFSFLTPDVSSFDLREWETKGVTLFGEFTADFLDNIYFPKEGGLLKLKTVFSDKKIIDGSSFLQAYGQGRKVFRANKKLSIDTGFNIGSVSGKDIPFNYFYYLGGVNENKGTTPFYGLNPMEKIASDYVVLRTGFFYEVSRNRFISAHYNIAKINNQKQGLKSLGEGGEYVKGSNISFGAMTPVGPFNLGVSFGKEAIGYMNIGYSF